tara:strand:- start:340 stop:624 length:285 start_codon:yes stop_codon:yes gene_type:complete
MTLFLGKLLKLLAKKAQTEMTLFPRKLFNSFDSSQMKLFFNEKLQSQPDEAIQKLQFQPDDVIEKAQRKKAQTEMTLFGCKLLKRLKAKSVKLK